MRTRTIATDGARLGVAEKASDWEFQLSMDDSIDMCSRTGTVEKMAREERTFYARRYQCNNNCTLLKHFDFYAIVLCDASCDFDEPESSLEPWKTITYSELEELKGPFSRIVDHLPLVSRSGALTSKNFKSWVISMA